MQFSNPFVIIYVVGVATSYILWLALKIVSLRHRRTVTLASLPPKLAEAYTHEQIEASKKYGDACNKFAIVSGTVETVLGVALLCGGYFAWAANFCARITQSAYLFVILFAVLAGIPLSLIEIPFDLYGEFVIEKKFGFSKMTLGLWLRDNLVSLVVSAVIAVPLLLILVALVSHTTLWWLLLGAVYVAFSLGLSVIYPLVIAPLFNKFTPLEDGELKTRVTSYLEKSGFKAQGVFVMDASKRSGHSNAYFTGFGKSKRVVLYDTLIEQLSVDELGAVLAHELGHYKHHHIAKRLFLTIPIIFVALFVVSLLVALPELYAGFGFAAFAENMSGLQTAPLANGFATVNVSPLANVMQNAPIYFVGAFLLGEIFENFSVFAGAVANKFSRRDEYQADDYAKKLCGTGEPLITSLIKLNKENKSEVMPARIVSAFYYSHPTLAERIAKLEQ